MSPIASSTLSYGNSHFLPLYGLSIANKDDVDNFIFEKSKELKHVKNVIYVLYDPATLKSYIGKTDQLVLDRLNQHQLKLNSSNDWEELSSVYRYFKENCQVINFGIVDDDFSPHETLEDKEKKIIARIPSGLNLNSNKGGGGGTSLERAQQVYEQVFGSPAKREKEPPIQTTPDKRYPFNGNKFELTPNAKKAEACVYSILNEETREIYVGQTGRLFSQRSSEHTLKARNILHANSFSHRRFSQSNRLYLDMKQNPQAFSIGFHTGTVLSPKWRLTLEQKLIMRRNSCLRGYNSNGGRGGSVSLSFLKKRFKKSSK
jgi:hypothetical protein